MQNLKVLILLLCSLLSGCGYRWQPDFLEGARPTITVPFVAGDQDGAFTAEIVQALSASGLAEVSSSGGEYELQVSILGEDKAKIGFRVDAQKIKGKIRKNLLACEERKTLSIQVSLYAGQEVICGPYTITADAEYDYVDGDSIEDLTFVNRFGETVTVLPFSLGQLEPNELASRAANRPLYQTAAQKIVDLIASKGLWE